MSLDTAAVVGAIVGSLVAGALLGLIPLIIGLKKGKKGLAIGGFAACIVGSLIAGLLLNIPMCVLFTVLIFVLGKKTDAAVTTEQVEATQPSDDDQQAV
ncbi:MAG: hypothetical protein IIZ31_03700 [Lachnospiraceae bacterium]|nr:hypothetical protein [Lachnospiraceae bacterium]